MPLRAYPPPFLSPTRCASLLARRAAGPNSAAVAEDRPASDGVGAEEATNTAGGKGRSEEKEKEKGSNKAARQGRGGAGKGRGRGRKGQDGWRKKGEYAKKEDLLHQMKWPKTRRKVKTGGGGRRGLGKGWTAGRWWRG